jgi:NADH:ubiquinone oxidoreductase subunit F (NADH-binding)/NADH:ubiquinone oxidoreductase subunit E
LDTIDLIGGVPLGVAARPSEPGDGAGRRKKRREGKGRPVDPQALLEVRALLGDEPRRRDLLIEHLHKIQDHYKCISAEHAVALAEEMRLSPVEVFEVATFYHHFDVVKEGDARPATVTVRVCDGLACELAGARNLLAMLRSGAYGEDVRLIAAPCVGRCETAPVAVVGQNAIGHASLAAVEAALDERAFEPVIPHYATYARYVADGGYAILKECVAGKRNAEELVGLMEGSGLRGLGGAGFPTGRKWRIVRNEPAPRMMAVNIDEGEPGTFKDRWHLERDPHRFLEGMLIAAWTVGVEAVYMYLRDEYAHARKILSDELDALRADPPVPLPHIELRRGAGAYICGEESAMIESIEGKRGVPRLRPPFVAQVGLFGRPTLQHNMETLYWVREIIEEGPSWFASFGHNGRSGLRNFSVSGRVQKPGVHLAPAGISARELIDEYCGGMLPGHDFYAFLPGGASGGILPATLGHVPLDFDTLNKYGCFIGSAAMIVLSHKDSARGAALNALRFFRDESCGQCTPCRVGTAKAVALMERDVWDQPLLGELSRVMMDASICGLGQAASNPYLCAMKYFPWEFEV